MRFILGLRALFLTWFDSKTADEVRKILDGVGPTALPAAAPSSSKHKPQRSEALTLLAALQREARFVDIVQEPLGDYTDAQIGAAARDVLRDCGTVLERFFQLQPSTDTAEGGEFETPAAVDAGCYRVTGNVQGQPPFRGRVVHHGWIATRCELPTWTGSSEAARVVAPIELEVSG